MSEIEIIEERNATKNKSPDSSVKYPSANLGQEICYNEYRHYLETYDKIYDKVSIALAFCGIILMVVLSSFDYTIILRIPDATNLELFALMTYLCCSGVAVICLIWSVVKLLLLMRSRELTVFDCIDIRNEGLYNETTDVAHMWIIDKLTVAITEIKPVIKKKQCSFDAAVVKIVIALIAYAVVLLIQKGL